METPRPNSFFKLPAQVLAVGVIIAAIFMGGATERMPQAIVLAAMGALMIIAPPPSWPDRKWTFAVLALLALAATGSLPAEWFRTESWRGAVRDAGITLPATLSPQPRLTLEAWLLLAAVGAHVAAALWHHFVRRDQVLTAMLPRAALHRPGVARTQSGMASR